MDRSAMFRRHCLGAAMLLLTAAPLALSAAPSIVGRWLTEDGDSRVEVTATPGADGQPVCSGKVVWLKQPQIDGQPVLDSHNGDAALRQRPLMGLQVLAGFRPEAGGVWSGGTVYAPRSGKTYPAELSLRPDGRLQLVVKAGLISRTVHWTR